MIKTLFIILLFTFSWFIKAQQSDFKHIDFTAAENSARLFEGEELYNLPLFTHNLTHNLKTDVARFRAIYFWVCHNIKNDYSLMMKNEYTRNKYINDTSKLHKWNASFKKEVFIKLLKDKKTLCSGYSYLIKEMAMLAGLDCKIINGYGKLSASFKSLKMPNHSWNAIKLNGKWYLCDATWSSGYVDSRYLFKFYYNDTFFLMPPEEFVKSHKPLNSMWQLLKNNTLK